MEQIFHLVLVAWTISIVGNMRVDHCRLLFCPAMGLPAVDSFHFFPFRPASDLQGSHFSGMTKFPDFSLTFPVFFSIFQYFFNVLFF